MALIPRAASVSRVIDDGQAPVATVNTSQVGQGLHHLAVAADKARDSRVRYQYAQAASDFLVKKTAQDNSYNDDQDYETILPRYSEATSKALEESAALIKDPTARNEFLLNFKPQVAQGQARIADIARGRERDYQRGYLQTQLTAMTDAGLTGDIPAAMDTASALLLSARDQGYVSAQEYATMQQGFRTDLVTRAVKMLDARGQLAATTQSWFKELPVDQQAILTRDAKAAVVREDAVVNVDNYMGTIRSGGSRAEVQAQIESITDPLVREATEQRFETEFSRHEKTKVEDQAALQQQYFLPIRQGTMSVDEIPREQLNRMEPAIVQSLYAAEQQAASGTASTASDRSVLDTLHQLNALAEAGRGSWIDVRKYFVENSHLLSQTDFDQWSKVSADGVVPGPVKAFISSQEMLRQKLKVLHNEQMPAFQREAIEGRELGKFNSWFMNYQQQNGKDPDDITVQRKIDELVLDTFVVDSEESWYGADVAWRQASSATRKAEIARIERDDADTAAAVRASLGPDATDDEFMTTYLTVKE